MLFGRVFIKIFTKLLLKLVQYRAEAFPELGMQQD